MPSRKKREKEKKELDDAKAPIEEKDVPRSMVFRRGPVGQSVRALEKDLRLVLSPYTADKLQETKKNALKDFINVAPVLGVSHLVIFRQTDAGVNLRFMRVPRGPTYTFRLMSYSLMRDIYSQQKRPHSLGPLDLNKSPLVVMNNFSSGESHKTLMTAMFQSLFPKLDVPNMKLSHARRVVMLNYNAATDSISFRHFVISLSPVGINKNVKRLIKGKIPNLKNVEDISEAIDAPIMSDSEADDIPDSRVTLGENYSGRGNKASHTSAIRLKEVGPRMELQLLKIEAGIGTGEVIYNKLHDKSEQDIEAMRKKKKMEAIEKKKRKEEQAANVEAKAARLAARNRGENIPASDEDSGAEVTEIAKPAADINEDATWYRMEVGEEPGAEEFPKKWKEEEFSAKKAKPQDPNQRAKVVSLPGGAKSVADKAPRKSRKEQRAAKAGKKNEGITSGKGKPKDSAKKRKAASLKASGKKKKRG
jgi:ribosome biogenesis protein SSF1/2